VSLPTPLDQTFAQATLPTQTTLNPGHPAVISLVIIAKKVQESVQSQHPQLDLKGVPGAARLTRRNPARNDDFPKKTGLFRGERQHVRG
jgi:hypothetical protein